MIDAIKLVQQELDPAGLSQDELQKILQTLTGKNIDYADLFFQSVYSESWSLEDSMIKHASFDIDRGIGVRAMSGEKTGFAYADDILKASLQQAVSAARGIAQRGGEYKVPIKNKSYTRELYSSSNPLKSLTEKEKVNLLQEIDRYIRKKDPRIVQAHISLAGEYEIVLIVNTEGEQVADIRPLVRFNASIILEQNGRRESGYAGGGGRYDYRHFMQNNILYHFADEALRHAQVNLDAIPAPAGPMTVVLGPGWPGVLLHEAVGHGLEGDFNRKGISIYSNRRGELVASKLCTVVDNGSLPNARGSMNIDDEGTPTQKTVLIENGVLRGYMLDKRNARLMGLQSTGNGRRESYADLPIPRMTNTYLLPGQSDPEEILKTVKKGIYAVNFGGGQVDITSGKFVFSMSEAYLIEGGKIIAPVKGATLIGNGPDVLSKVSMVGNNLELDSGIGVCGKDGQSVPVGVGQPTVLVDEIIVGGTAE